MNNRLIIGFTLIAIITGFNAITHSENYSGTEIFDKYGFSFRYPGNFRAFEGGYPNYGDGASDFSGAFQANLEEDQDFKEILVIWSTINEPKSLDEELHNVIEGISEEVTIKQMGWNVKTYVGENNTAHYVYGEFSQGGLNFNAIISLQIIPWESLRSYRGYVVGYIAIEGVYTEAELDAVFRAFMTDFNPNTK